MSSSSYTIKEITITDMMVLPPTNTQNKRRWQLFAFNNEKQVINAKIQDSCLNQLMIGRKYRSHTMKIANKRYTITFNNAHFDGPGENYMLVPDTRLDQAQNINEFLNITHQNWFHPTAITPTPTQDRSPQTTVTPTTPIQENSTPTSGRSLFWPLWTLGTALLSIGCGALTYRKWPQIRTWLSETVPPLLDYLSGLRDKAASYLAIE